MHGLVELRFAEDIAPVRIAFENDEVFLARAVGAKGGQQIVAPVLQHASALCPPTSGDVRGNRGVPSPAGP